MAQLMTLPKPTFMDEQHKEIYDRLLGVLNVAGEMNSNTDLSAIDTFAYNLYLQELCKTEIAEKGMSVECTSDRGQTIHKKNPALDALNQVQSALRFYYKQFKMTPDSRGKVLNPKSAAIPDDV